MGSNEVTAGLWLAMMTCGCGGALPPAPPPAAAGDPEPTHYVATFRLEEAATDAETDTPHTAVAWVMHSETAPSVARALGVETGACTQRADDPEILARVTCWWGGTRALWRVRRSEAGVHLERAEAPDAPWEERGVIALPDDATIELLR